MAFSSSMYSAPTGLFLWADQEIIRGIGMCNTLRNLKRQRLGAGPHSLGLELTNSRVATSDAVV